MKILMVCFGNICRSPLAECILTAKTKHLNVIVDSAGTADSNNITIGRNSEKIHGASEDMTVATERAAFTLVYTDSTQGWLLTEK